MATWSRRRSSSTSSGWPVARSDGRQPSARWIRWTTSHSAPLAEWMVDRVRKSSSRWGGPARSPVDAGRVERELGEEALEARGRAGGLPRRRSRSARRAVGRCGGGARPVVEPAPHRRDLRAGLLAQRRRAGGVEGGAQRGQRHGAAVGAGQLAGRGEVGAGRSAAVMRRAQAGPTPSTSWRTRNQASSSAGFSTRRRVAHEVLHVGRLEEAQPAVEHERDVADGQLHLRAPRCGGWCGTAPPGGAGRRRPRGARAPRRTPRRPGRARRGR